MSKDFNVRACVSNESGCEETEQCENASQRTANWLHGVTGKANETSWDGGVGASWPQVTACDCPPNVILRGGECDCSRGGECQAREAALDGLIAPPSPCPSNHDINVTPSVPPVHASALSLYMELRDRHTPVLRELKRLWFMMSIAERDVVDVGMERL